jgi:hypothetical protein
MQARITRLGMLAVCTIFATLLTILRGDFFNRLTFSFCHASGCHFLNFCFFSLSAVVGYSKSLRDFIEDDDRTETKPKRTKTETNKKNNSITLFGNLPEN